MRVTGRGWGALLVPDDVSCLEAQTPRSQSVLGTAPHPPPAQTGQAPQFIDEKRGFMEAKAFSARSCGELPRVMTNLPRHVMLPARNREGEVAPTL